jgi:hypothetical protein
VDDRVEVLETLYSEVNRRLHGKRPDSRTLQHRTLTAQGISPDTDAATAAGIAEIAELANDASEGAAIAQKLETAAHEIEDIIIGGSEQITRQLEGIEQEVEPQFQDIVAEVEAMGVKFANELQDIVNNTKPPAEGDGTPATQKRRRARYTRLDMPLEM